MPDAIERQELKDKWIEFFDRYGYENRIAEIEVSDVTSLRVSYRDVEQFDPEFADDLLSEPEEWLYNAGIAASEPVETDVSVRIEDHPDVMQVDELRDRHAKRLVAVEGLVQRVTPTRTWVEEPVFQCLRCDSIVRGSVRDEELKEPDKCNCERQGPFDLLYSRSTRVNYQKVRIQEPPEETEASTNTQELDVHLTDALTSQVNPGDRVEITGVLDVRQIDDSPVFRYELRGNHLEIEDKAFEDIEVSQQEEERIHRVASESGVYDRLVDSLAPSIYGYRDIKLALVLQMFSGVTKRMQDGSRLRGDIHTLLVGDPGTAKSMLLQRADELAPRSVYTSGDGSSAAGLTAAAVQEDMGFNEGKWTLEAGALVLADKGLACIDELDKMRESDRSALHEALEQQQTSVSKAGINATLKTRTSMLAAANPKHGRFDEYESIPEQIDIDPPLVSRFDLIFKILDNPDDESDSELAEHILRNHEVGGRLEAGCEVEGSHAEPPLEREFFRKYVAYARSTCVPVISGEARDVLTEFFVELRNGGEIEAADNSVPVTARKLEALIRLAEAAARARLSDEVTRGDAEVAIRLTRASLRDSNLNEFGELDADMTESDMVGDQRRRIKFIKDYVRSKNDVRRRDVIDELASEVEGKDKIDHDLDFLLEKGELERLNGYLHVP